MLRIGGFSVNSRRVIERLNCDSKLGVGYACESLEHPTNRNRNSTMKSPQKITAIVLVVLLAVTPSPHSSEHRMW